MMMFVNISLAFITSNSRDSDINNVIFIDCPATFAFCFDQSYTKNHLSQRVYFLMELGNICADQLLLQM